MEYENKYASKGVGGTALGIGIGALGLEVLRGGLGGVGGLFGGGNASCEHDAVLRARIAELETEVKLRDANIYTDSKLNDFRNYVDSKFDGVNAAICQQNVLNATTGAALNCINGQIASLMSLTKVVIPTASICPEPMARYNSWTAPTATT
jgi:hypothetical protein